VIPSFYWISDWTIYHNEVLILIFKRLLVYHDIDQKLG